MKWLVRAATMAAGLWLAVSAIANAEPELGPEVGSEIPHRLNLADQTGEIRSFESLLGEKGAAIYFNRSVDWCPYCQIQTKNVSARLRQFEARGVKPVVVTYDSVEELSEFAAKERVVVTLLSDPDSAAIKAFGLLNETLEPDNQYYGLPYPAIFLVDREGVIRAKFYETDYLTNARSYRNRPEIELVLQAADRIFKATP